MLGLAWLARRPDDPRPHGGLYGAGIVRPPWSERPGLPGLEETARDGLVGSLFRDQQPAGEVDRHAGATDEGERGKDDPDDGDVGAQVLGDSGGDPRYHPVLDRTAQQLGPALVGVLRAGFSSGCVHASSVVGRVSRGYREDP